MENEVNESQKKQRRRKKEKQMQPSWRGKRKWCCDEIGHSFEWQGAVVVAECAHITASTADARQARCNGLIQKLCLSTGDRLESAGLRRQSSASVFLPSWSPRPAIVQHALPVLIACRSSGVKSRKAPAQPLTVAFAAHLSRSSAFRKGRMSRTACFVLDSHIRILTGIWQETGLVSLSSDNYTHLYRPTTLFQHLRAVSSTCGCAPH
jgi:hypothetical protein